jgi:hypothetical protein
VGCATVLPPERSADFALPPSGRRAWSCSGEDIGLEHETEGLGTYWTPAQSEFQSGRPDLNRGPLVPQTSALTRLRHAPYRHTLARHARTKISSSGFFSSFGTVLLSAG